LTLSEKRFKAKDFLHFTPFALCLIYLLPYYFQSGADKLKEIVAEHFLNQAARLTNRFTWAVHGIAYISYSSLCGEAVGAN
jgi:hypothetical protein